MLTPLAYLLLQIPYSNSTKAKDRLRQRKKNRFLDVLSARIDLKHTKPPQTPHHSLNRNQKPETTTGLMRADGHGHRVQTVTNTLEQLSGLQTPKKI